MTDIVSKLLGGLGGLLALAILIGGPVSCSVLGQKEVTRRVEAACAGDMGADVVRATICAQALAGAGK